jgi:hypothetical protein
VDVPSIVEPFLTLPMRCNSEGTIFLRMADGEGIADLVSISSDGQKVVGYGSAKINDVTRPREQSFFTTDSDVYILVTGSVPEGRTLRLRTPDGALQQQAAYKTNVFLAHFRKTETMLGRFRWTCP